MAEEKNTPGFTIGTTMYFDGNTKLSICVGKQVVITMGDEYDIQTLQHESVPIETMRDFLQKTIEIIDSAIENHSDDVEA
jgi:hypothetical protein